MEAGQVIDKILADAQAQAQQIKAESDEKSAAEQKSLEQQLEQFKKETDELAKSAAEDKKSQMLAAARMENARKFLTEKANLLDEVFKKAREQMLQMPDEQYKQLMKKLMLKTVETGDEEIIIDSKEKRIDFEFIKSINRELGPGFKGNLRLSEEKQNIGAGFILKRGKIKNNVSLDVLLQTARENMQADIAKELFAESK
ncbi:MAG: V-type ATP synthase subunit E [Phycisphaerae bacterium]